jgi:hypothetical protein
MPHVINQRGYWRAWTAARRPVPPADIPEPDRNRGTPITGSVAQAAWRRGDA